MAQNLDGQIKKTGEEFIQWNIPRDPILFCVYKEENQTRLSMKIKVHQQLNYNIFFKRHCCALGYKIPFLSTHSPFFLLSYVNFIRS